MKNIIYVYELIEDLQVFYIGLTKNPKMRLRHHQRNYGEDISMRLFYATWDIGEANRVEVERISETECLDNVALGGGYGPRFYKQTKINTEINGDEVVANENIEIIKASLAEGGNNNFETIIYPNLNHLFQQELKLPPMRVLLDYRLDQACALLRHGDASIDEIAEQSGLVNRHYLSRMMRQYRGTSPAAYRRESAG